MPEEGHRAGASAGAAEEGALAGGAAVKLGNAQDMAPFGRR